MLVRQDGNVTYKIPRLILKDYSGPTLRAVPAGFGIDYRRLSIRIAAIRCNLGGIDSEAPSGVTGTIITSARPCRAEFAYSGAALRDIKAGKIAALQVERASFTVNTQNAGKSDKMTGEIANLASRDFDAAALAAILDPQKANEDRYIRAYGKTTAGPYTVTSAQGLRMRIDAMTVDDVAVRPSKLQLPTLLAMIQAPEPLSLRRRRRAS